MKAIYFIRPILRMFDFKGRTGRAEYFAYTIPSALVACIAFMAAAMLMGPLAMKLGEDRRFIYLFGGPLAQTLFPAVVVFVTQFPMLALTMRRLRDQRAAGTAVVWFFIPWLGPLVLFIRGFNPTFHERFVTVPDGRTMLLSAAMDERRQRNRLIALGLFTASLIVLTEMAASDDGGSYVGSGGGRKRGVKGSPWKADGSINNRNNILGGRKAHMRGGSSVKASHNKYTWN